ncbi:MAG: hypothetical protein MK135_08020 [Polyangiaceae bacterium]|nr:hypothetical protein [Polyangiaceae bacterium]
MALQARILLLLGSFLICTACAHPAERALEGEWWGTSVENFDDAMIASATGWARGTRLAFRDHKLIVSLPSEKSRQGTFRLTAIEDREVQLAVLDAEGVESELRVIVDDEDTIRWVLGDGRTMVLHKH